MTNLAVTGIAARTHHTPIPGTHRPVTIAYTAEAHRTLHEALDLPADAVWGEAQTRIERPVLRLERGEPLFRAGEDADALYVVESGTIKLSAVTRQGEEHVIDFVYPGELCGLDMLGAGRHEHSAVALEPAVVLALPSRTLEKLTRQIPTLPQRLRRLLAQRITRLHAQMLTLGRKSAEERLANFLVALDGRLHRPPEAAQEIHLSMSRYEIGCHLGLALETVSRLLRHLHDERVIRVHGRHIHFLNVERLRAIAGLTTDVHRAGHG